MQRDEGVIKYVLEHRSRELDAGRPGEVGRLGEERRLGEVLCKLVAWRELLALTGLVGQNPARYGGAGYGNVSARVGRPSEGRGRRTFVTTGTQTSGKRCVDVGDFAVVERYDYRLNRVWSYGPVAPSSESLTHAALYDVGPQIRSVLHAHSPVLWRRARELRIPITDPAAAYGTPAMAEEVQRLYQTRGLAELRILSMGGHEDGIVVFGRSPEEAGRVLMTWLARAYEADCLGDGLGLCRIE